MQGIERRSGDGEGLAANGRKAVANPSAGVSIPAVFPPLFPDCVFAPDVIAHPGRPAAAGAGGTQGSA